MEVSTSVDGSTTSSSSPPNQFVGLARDQSQPPEHAEREISRMPAIIDFFIFPILQSAHVCGGLQCSRNRTAAPNAVKAKSMLKNDVEKLAATNYGQAMSIVTKVNHGDARDRGFRAVPKDLTRSCWRP